jgi:Cys-tRNA(Pro)/Cys-tRNA(Cys) deacylase
MASNKTLAMKFLDGKKVSYRALTYPDNLRDAEEVAQALGLPADQVYKTLVVTRPGAGKPILAIIPANRQLDPKALAKNVGEKKLKMASHREAEALTGLKVGGISALALVNRGFQVFVDETAASIDEIVVSAGERGQQIELAPADLLKVTRARYAAIAAADAEQ